MTNRVSYLDGLKGWMAVCVVLTHYMLALWPKGFVGFGSGVEENMRGYVTAQMPWSLFSNSSISLYLLFAMISFFIVLSYRSSGNALSVLQRQASKRYFQFLIPVFAATVCAYGLYGLGALAYEPVAEMTGSSWNRAIEPTTGNAGLMLFYALFGIYFNNQVEFLTVLWCMHIIFIGSYLTYGILALFGNYRKRFICYLIFFAVALFYPSYFIFAAGAICGELFFQQKSGSDGKRSKGTQGARTLGGVFCVLAGVAIGLIPAPLLPGWLNLEVTYACSGFLILSGLTFCRRLQRFLSWKGFVWLGKYLFSIILVHIFVLYTFSAWLYKILSSQVINGGLLYILTALISLPVIFLCSACFYKLFEEPSRRLAEYIGRRAAAAKTESGGEAD